MSESKYHRRSFGRGIMRAEVLVLVVVLALVFILTYEGPLNKIFNTSSPKIDNSATVESAAGKLAKQKEDCQNSITQQRVAYAAHMKERKYWQAASQIRICAEVLSDSELLALVKDAEVKSHLAEIQDPNILLPVKERAEELLARDYPDVYAKYEPEIRKQLAAAKKRSAAAEAQRKRSQGVTLGMSKDEVLASSWGKPQHVSRTTSPLGTMEIWIYGIGSLLYFQNGVLITIQN